MPRDDLGWDNVEWDYLGLDMAFDPTTSWLHATEGGFPLFDWHAKAGFLAAVPQAIAQYVAARKLTPVKVLVYTFCLVLI